MIKPSFLLVSWMNWDRGGELSGVKKFQLFGASILLWPSGGLVFLRPIYIHCTHYTGSVYVLHGLRVADLDYKLVGSCFFLNITRVGSRFVLFMILQYVQRVVTHFIE